MISYGPIRLPNGDWTGRDPTPDPLSPCKFPLRKAIEAHRSGIDPAPRVPLAPEERELVKRLAEFPGVVREASDRRGPHAVPVYAIRLADDFHRFYDKHRGYNAYVIETRSALRCAV